MIMSFTEVGFVIGLTVSHSNLKYKSSKQTSKELTMLCDARGPIASSGLHSRLRNRIEKAEAILRDKKRLCIAETGRVKGRGAGK